jgi:hypothetical protein
MHDVVAAENFGGFHGATANGGLYRFDFGLVQTVPWLQHAVFMQASDSHQPYGSYTTLTRPCLYWSLTSH